MDSVIAVAAVAVAVVVELLVAVVAVEVAAAVLLVPRVVLRLSSSLTVTPVSSLLVVERKICLSPRT